MKLCCRFLMVIGGMIIFSDLLFACQRNETKRTTRRDLDIYCGGSFTAALDRITGKDTKQQPLLDLQKDEKVIVRINNEFVTFANQDDYNEFLNQEANLKENKVSQKITIEKDGYVLEFDNQQDCDAYIIEKAQQDKVKKKKYSCFGWFYGKNG